VPAASTATSSSPGSTAPATAGAQGQWSPPAQRSPWTEPTSPPERQSWQPRIAPSPPRKGRLAVGILIGVLVGLVVFGTAGYFVGDYRAGSEPTSPPSPSGPLPTGSLPAYETGQLALNRSKVSGDLAVIAEPWLAWVGGCSSSADQFGQKLETGEQTRVFCEYSNVSVFFVQYKTVADRDAKRAARQRQNTDAQALTPGAQPPSKKTGTSGRTTGQYIEYAFRIGSGDQARTVAGIWWEQDGAPVAAYIEVLWTGIDQKWEPFRDLWTRYG
jgi:hypothetical protein